MKRFSLVALWILICSATYAQTDEFLNAYDEFRRQAQAEYEDFRNEANKRYADFVRQAWQYHNVLPAIEKPKREEVPPVVMPKDDRDKPLKDTPVPIDEVVAPPPAPKPQPVPVAPIREQPQPAEQYVTFRFFGTECKVRFSDDERFRLSGCNNEAVATAWERMSGEAYNNTLRDCLELRIRMQLCDWAYLNMIAACAEACLGKGNEARLLMAYIYCQSGYKMRLGMTTDKLCMLYASEHTIYGRSYFKVDGEMFYPYDDEEGRMRICGASFPEERPLSLWITAAQNFAYNGMKNRMLQADGYKEMKVEASVNKNLIDFYDSYPSSEVGGNFMTRWAVYANAEMEESMQKSLYPTLKGILKGRNELEAAERLLNFVQTAFVYEYDDKVWGEDRAFFAEETLYYPYCDCEDRSILFSRLVRDLLGLDVILVYYPGHLATAVCFNSEVKGDYITLNGRPFVVCDPTYIGAPVGCTMPSMDNKAAKVIFLGNDIAADL